ncbi:hypothetical protein BS17DRAFT_818897 [Gyrodon lividus]|nr:hypothetical protein BS17DRAFT_818897 [Gyrodon lividus]
MPAKIFSNEQTAILESVLMEYQGLVGKDKVHQKEIIVTQIVEKVVKVHHRSDIQGMKKLHKLVRNWLNNRSWEMSDEEEYF